MDENKELRKTKEAQAKDETISQEGKEADPITASCGMPSKENDEITNKLNAFKNSMPEQLRGKRPKDMNQEEKKEYNNYKKKLSRANKTK